MRLLRAGVNVVVAHTDFDAAPGGAADSLAMAIGLANPTPFGADEDEGVPDIGRVGDYQGSLADLTDVVTRVLGSPAPRVSGNLSQPVSRVAVIPGSGSDFISQAVPLADALITGDVGHHKAVAALDAGLSVIDPGHIATERPGMTSLVAMIRSIAGIEVVDLNRSRPADLGLSHRYPPGFMEITSLADLLDVQDLDLQIDRLLDRRKSLPELGAYKAAHEKQTALEKDLKEASSALKTLELDFDKSEGELEMLEGKLTEHETRLYAGGMSARETEYMRLEVQSLKGQRSAMEERVLALLENLDPVRGSVDDLTAESQALSSERKPWRR